tara:strand:- start:746 stop:898 length:153 start_codon:yes stop_codon:yes gene_type:complete
MSEQLKENVVYEFQNGIPVGWYEISRRYEKSISGKEVVYIKCISHKSNDS